MHPNTTTVGVRTESKEKLEEIAEIEDESMTRKVSEMIDEYYKILQDEELTENEVQKLKSNGATNEQINRQAKFEL